MFYCSHHFPFDRSSFPAYIPDASQIKIWKYLCIFFQSQSQADNFSKGGFGNLLYGTFTDVGGTTLVGLSDGIDNVVCTTFGPNTSAIDIEIKLNGLMNGYNRLGKCCCSTNLDQVSTELFKNCTESIDIVNLFLFFSIIFALSL